MSKVIISHFNQNKTNTSHRAFEECYLTQHGCLYNTSKMLINNIDVLIRFKAALEFNACLKEHAVCLGSLETLGSDLGDCL